MREGFSCRCPLALGNLPLPDRGLEIRGLLAVSGLLHPGRRRVELSQGLTQTTQLDRRHGLFDRDLGQAALVVQPLQDLEGFRVGR